MGVHGRKDDVLVGAVVLVRAQALDDAGHRGGLALALPVEQVFF